jgi:Amt family ammonium transporter
VSAGWHSIGSENLYLKFIFQFAFANAASSIVAGLVTERCRLETYGALSFIMTLFIYPVVACWVWNPSGWLAVRGFHDFAGSSVVHLVGGASGLVSCLMVGQRFNRFKAPQLPCLCRKRR